MNEQTAWHGKTQNALKTKQKTTKKKALATFTFQIQQEPSAVGLDIKLILYRHETIYIRTKVL